MIEMLLDDLNQRLVMFGQQGVRLLLGPVRQQAKERVVSLWDAC